MFMSSKLSDTEAQQAQVYIESVTALRFEDLALEVFRFQYENNELYRSFCNAIGRKPEQVGAVAEIPFLPISFFKTHRVWTGDMLHEAGLVFESSGTTGETPSRHFVRDAALCEASLMAGFKAAFGPPEEYVFLALLPSYLERKNASLVHMAQTLMARGRHPESGFFLNEWQELAARMQQLRREGRKAILLGVSFALLDFAEAFPMNLEGITVMETGGMKGRREEWTRNQLHEFLKAQWQLPAIVTEYGMTELLSQAYAPREGLLTPSPTMRVLVRELSDPLHVAETGHGALNIIDLANLHSCAFIATDDVGVVHDAQSFEVLGRSDYSALRGCSLMTA
jgi:phenylacetate-coenzyme A ligase PaaK-like adenylate-forming protein